MSRRVALLVAVVGGAVLGYWLLRIVFDALAWLGFGVMDGPPLPAWTDALLGAAIVGAGLACWAACAWLIWRILASGRRGTQ